MPPAASANPYGGYPAPIPPPPPPQLQQQQYQMPPHPYQQQHQMPPQMQQQAMQMPMQQAAGTAAGSAAAAQGTKAVPLERVIDDVAAMGFSRGDVRAAVASLMAQGQSVDLNVVLDRLMNGPRR